MQFQVKELKDLSVSLLFEDAARAQLITAQLRKLGIFAHYYSNIHDFWTNCLHQSIDVLIAENRNLESSGISIVDHPRLKNKQVSVIIHSDEPALIRVDIATQVRCLGFINGSQVLDSQIAVLMNSALEIERLKNQNYQLTEHRERLRNRNQELLEGFEKSKQFADEFFFTQQMLEMIDQKLELGFENSIDLVFEKLNFIKRYAILGINGSQTQVISLHKKNRKTSDFINLWESSSLSDGMKPLVIQRIMQVGHDLLGENLVGLKIQGNKIYPELLIILCIEDKGSHLFPWKTLEEQMSLRFLSCVSQETKVLSEITRWSAWEMLSYLDEVHYHHARSPKAMLVIDFSQMLSFVHIDHHQNFYWEKFQKDFESEIIKHLGHDFIFVDYGIEKMVLMVNQEQVSTAIMMLEDLIEFFEFWRYFENTTLVMSQKIMPTVSVAASASQNFFKKMESRKLNQFTYEWDEGNAH